MTHDRKLDLLTAQPITCSQLRASDVFAVSYELQLLAVHSLSYAELRAQSLTCSKPKLSTPASSTSSFTTTFSDIITIYQHFQISSATFNIWNGDSMNSIFTSYHPRSSIIITLYINVVLTKNGLNIENVRITFSGKSSPLRCILMNMSIACKMI